MVYILSNSKNIISIIDDEVDITETFYEVLCKTGEYSVFAFNDSITALNHFIEYEKDYALVISDLRMPRLSGWDLLVKIKKINPYIRTILMTAYEVETNKLEEYIAEEVIDKFPQKPIGLNDLLAGVKNQLHIYELQKKEKGYP